KQLATLGGTEASDWEWARRELVRLGKRNRGTLLALLGDPEKPLPARIAAVGALQSLWDGAVQKGFQAVLEGGEPDLRRLAAEGLGLNADPGDAEVHAALLRALADEDPAVRRAAALAMGRVNAPGAADALVNTLAFDDGKDV